MKNICLAFLILIEGCRKNVPDAIIDVNVAIHYINKNGGEFFYNGSLGSNGVNINDVRLLYIKNGVKEVIFTPPTRALKLDYPYGYIPDTSSIKKYVVVFSNSYIVNDTATTLIDLTSSIEDTLKCSFFKPNSNPASIAVDKVWYNGQLMGRRFDIVK